MVASVVDSIVEETTGKDASQRLISALQSGHEDDDHMETGLGTEVASLATADDRCRPKWRGRGLRQSSPKYIARGGIRQSGGTERHLDQDDAKCQRDKTAWRFRSRQRHPLLGPWPGTVLREPICHSPILPAPSGDKSPDKRHPYGAVFQGKASPEPRLRFITAP